MENVQYLQLFDEHLSSGVTFGTIRRLRANTPTATDSRLSGNRVVCGVSCSTRVCPYSVSYRVAVRACVALWYGVVRCGADRSARASSLWFVATRPSEERSSVFSVRRHGVRFETIT